LQRVIVLQTPFCIRDNLMLRFRSPRDRRFSRSCLAFLGNSLRSS
jgi:hypothetical protein